MQEYKEKTTERLTSGESKTIFRNTSCIVIIGLTTSGRKAWQEDEETRKDVNIVLIHHDKKFSIAINLHSIINSGLTPGGQILSNRQTDSILSACGPHAKRTQGS